MKVCRQKTFFATMCFKSLVQLWPCQIEAFCLPSSKHLTELATTPNNRFCEENSSKIYCLMFPICWGDPDPALIALEAGKSLQPARRRRLATRRCGEELLRRGLPTGGPEKFPVGHPSHVSYVRRIMFAIVDRMERLTDRQRRFIKGKLRFVYRETQAVRWQRCGIRAAKEIGLDIMGGNRQCNATMIRRYHSWFGTDPRICFIIWTALVDIGWIKRSTIKRHHILWALWFLKTYNTLEVHSTQLNVDEKSFQKWVWIVLEGVSKLDKVIASQCYFI